MTVSDKGAAHPKHRNRLLATLRALIRTRLTTGVVTILPLLVTFWVIRFVFEWMRDASGWALKGLLLSPGGRPYLEHLHFNFERWNRLIEMGLPHAQEQFFEMMPWHVRWGIGAVAVLLTVLVLYAVGIFAANLIGRRVIDFIEQWVDRVPFVKTVYRGLKQVLDSFTGEATQKFQRVAMFPFLTPGVYSLGFVTNIFADPDTGEEYATVFYATTPIPTTGFVFMLRRNDIVELDWTFEETIKAIMSGGILIPDRAQMPKLLQALAAKTKAAPPAVLPPGLGRFEPLAPASFDPGLSPERD